MKDFRNIPKVVDYLKPIQTGKRRCVRRIAMSKIHDNDNSMNEASLNYSNVSGGSFIFQNSTNDFAKLTNSFVSNNSMICSTNTFRPPYGPGINSNQLRFSFAQKRHASSGRHFRM